MVKFEESRWGETEYAQEYRDHSQHFLPERNTHFEILASFYHHFVQKKRVLDLGCGDGIISERLFLTRCVTSKCYEAIKIKWVTIIDDVEKDTHGMG